MTIGEKIRQCRKERNITQSALADGIVTRNMLSAIEAGKATPSLATLNALAAALDVPVGYFLDEEDDLAAYRKMKAIGRIRAEYRAHRYANVIDYAEPLKPYDDEIAYLLTYSYFSCGKQALVSGSLVTAAKYFALAEETAPLTCYDTSPVRTFLPVYTTVCRTPETPLFHLDETAFRGDTLYSEDLEFAMYIFRDPTFGYKKRALSEHLQARSLVRQKRYQDAIAILRAVADERHDGFENAYVMFSVYADLETCYRELADFEQAYRYASKRMTIMQGFSS